jgi:cell division transport system permease protein
MHYFSLGKILRTPISSFITIAVIGIALALPTNFYVLLRSWQNLSQKWNDDSAKISLYLKTNITPNMVQDLIQKLKADPKISNIKHISAQQGLQEFSEILGDDKMATMLPKNPLPELIIINPIPELRTLQAINSILYAMKALPEVEAVQFDLQWLQRLDNIITLVNKIIWALEFLLGIGVLLIISNTIRLVTKNAGVTLYAGIWYGLFGGLTAWGIEALVLTYLETPVKNLAKLYSSNFYIYSLSFSNGLYLLLFSILIGLRSSWLSNTIDHDKL